MIMGAGIVYDRLRRGELTANLEKVLDNIPVRPWDANTGRPLALPYLFSSVLRFSQEGLSGLCRGPLRFE